MPDLATHVLAAYIVKKAARIKLLVLFLLGTILPDILSRPFYIPIPSLFWFVKPFHSVFVIIMVCLLLSYFFPETGRKNAFNILLAGALFHLFLDLFQMSIYPGYVWFFPLSTYSFTIGLFWPGEPIFALPLLAFISLAVYLKTKKTR